MTRIKNNINTYADLTAYNADLNKDFPNISYIQGSDEVKYSDTVIYVTYNVTSTSETIKLIDTTAIIYQYIDGVKQDRVQTTYTFDSLGEHNAKYKFTSFSTNTQVFYACTNITNVIIYNGIRTIALNSFNGCANLTSILIPESVTSIENFVFYNCSSLTSVTVNATIPPLLGNKVFSGTANNLVIYVPAASVEAYKAAENWSSLADRIQAIP